MISVQWGLPKFKFNSFFSMLPGVYISLFEILANYYIITETGRSEEEKNKTHLLHRRGILFANYYCYFFFFSELHSTFQMNGNRNKLLNRNTWSLFLILEGVLSLLIGSLAPGLCLTVDLRSRSQVCTYVHWHIIPISCWPYHTYNYEAEQRNVI